MSDGNGRVTLAILSTKLDMVLKRLDELTECYHTDHDRLSALGAQADENRRTIERLWQTSEQQDKRIEDLDKRDKVWAAIYAVAMAISTALGIKLNL